MREKEVSTVALQLVLRDYILGYTKWVSFRTDIEKVASKSAQWEVEYGTRLLPYQKQRRKRDGLPTASATSMPAVGHPHAREIILMATPLVQDAHPASPWHKQQWRADPPEFGVYVMVREPRVRGDYAWTWRIQQDEMSKLSSRLTAVVKAGNAATVRRETEIWLKVFSMQGGVRRQFSRMLRSAKKLWDQCHKSPWPGVDPDALPAIVQFRKESKAETVSRKSKPPIAPIASPLDAVSDQDIEGS